MATLRLKRSTERVFIGGETHWSVLAAAHYEKRAERTFWLRVRRALAVIDGKVHDLYR